MRAPGMGSRTRRTALALLLALCASGAHALTLGEIEVRSALGEPLDARIPVFSSPGEWFDGRCFSLVNVTGPGAPRISEGRLAIERSASGAFLRIRSTQPVHEPASNMRLAINCAGAPTWESREFAVLVDPRVTPAAPSVASAAPPTAASSVTMNLDSRPGDTLESIAATLFQDNRGARASYLEALRAANPSIASRGDRAPIAADEVIALPDLRAFVAPRGQAPARSAAPRATPPAPAATVAEAPSAAAERPTAAPKAAPRAAAKKPAAERPPVARAPAPARSRPTAGFQLKLSAPEIDMSRSREIDDRLRGQLRERLLMLDADDQVASMLAMRNSLKQLEARVAELQLKLAGMPPSLGTKGETAPAKTEPAAVAKPEPAIPAKIEPPKIEPPVVAPSAPQTKAEVAVAPAPGATEESAKVPATATPAPAPAAQAPVVPEVRSTPRAIPNPVAPPSEPLPDWLWSVVALFVVLVMLLLWYLYRRSRTEVDEFDEMLRAPPHTQQPQFEIAPHTAFIEDPPEPERVHRAEVASDAELTTRIPVENADELRRRYIEERFPEIVTRMIVLDDPDSVVKGARLFYEDGAVTRAVELLQYAIEVRPQELKTWLALFEIFRLERLTGEFADLARRFKEQHSGTDEWRKVQYFGREIEPGNALYQEAVLSTLETIGPREARRLAAAAAANFDPIAENWLNAPADYENAALASELRHALMAAASITEHDLIPNPMPALRNIEMFTVA